LAPATWFAGAREIDRVIRITPRPNLSAPVLSFVGYLRSGGALDSHAEHPPENFIPAAWAPVSF
jgi:hypothetical protein